MRVIILGEPKGGLAEAIAARLAAAGADVLGAPTAADDVDDWAPLAGMADGGIDCAVVDRAAKARHVALLDRLLPAGAPLLTCCHAASATLTAAAIGGATRVVGFAWLPPWDGRATVELARAVQTADGAAAAADDVWRAAGLEPVWVGDSAGLVLPRIVACLANEAAFALMDRTATAGDIDRAMMLGTRYPRGPLAWADVIGLDHVLATLDELTAEHGEDRYRAAPLLRRLAAAGARLRPDLEAGAAATATDGTPAAGLGGR